MRNMVISLMIGFSVIFVGLMRYPIGSPVPVEIYTAPGDPCDMALQFLVPADPNWIKDYGDNERTRILYNVSVNRGQSLNNRNVIAEIARRLIALEQRNELHIEPNVNTIIDEVKE